MRQDKLLKFIPFLNGFFVVCLLFVVFSVVLLLNPPTETVDVPPLQAVAVPVSDKAKASTSARWVSPDSTTIPQTAEGDLIRYGRELVAHTALYLGPAGKIMAVSNGMNCQNCHLRAGKKFFGNNYSGVASTYPKFRARSGSVESIEKRVNDCIERSLNGKRIDVAGREMQAFVSYIAWVGSDVERDVYPSGAGMMDVPLLDRAASATLGKQVFDAQCVKCHGADGKGIREDNSVEWKYPPLQGEHSYNTGAGLFRLSRLAGFVKANMPYGASSDQPMLTDEEAWDVAAYVNSLPRPSKKFAQDWPDITTKPFDHPFGPYADGFSEQQHKFGPFGPIREKNKKVSLVPPDSLPSKKEASILR